MVELFRGGFVTNGGTSFSFLIEWVPRTEERAGVGLGSFHVLLDEQRGPGGYLISVSFN